ncbi:diguanylate cyclase domain-containing protein [Inquilinus limosus]|uniref:diguanylate cyclase domain-containing protein n=1 Tax=Inquilinus limosus TaxID=171674 RepID=UPI0015C58CF3|nr:diguanylate cyclase [Inquilinus limosus]
MSRRGDAREPRPPLRRVLRRAHLGVALLAVTLAGLTLTVAGFAALRAYAGSNLQLIATSMSYTVEAALVFKDRAAAEEALGLIASAEGGVAEANVFDAHGALFAHWQRPGGSALAELDHRLADIIFASPVLQPISHDGAGIGRVELHGNARGLLRFLAIGAVVVLVCIVLSALSALLLSRYLVAGIVGPLQTLATVAHRVRTQRTFDRRVPPAAIAELNELAGDFNALLGELEAWQARLQRENESLAHQASHDSLTGLPNRASFEVRLTGALQEAAAAQHRVAVLFLDSDNFKQTNDDLGHAAGDAVLAAVAARVRDQLRKTDLVARLGGDEFAVLLAPVTEIADALHVADDILASLQQPVRLPDGDAVTASVSIGIAVFPDHALDGAALLQRADAAMYLAKRLRPGGRELAAGPEPLFEERGTQIASRH